MSSGQELQDASGNRYRLETQLGTGGEGTVYSLTHQPSLVAKLYHQAPSAQTIAKLQAMVNLRSDKLEKMTAWPKTVLYRPGTRNAVGFLMPRVVDCEPIQHLYNPSKRLQRFPRETWLFLIAASANIAAAFDEVHQTGCLVGDVNEKNVLVSKQALVWLIDCDSFQVPSGNKPWLCEVGVTHYTSSELQGKNFRDFPRTKNHDRFGLAVLIYQLLFMGRHPYMGVYQGNDDPDFEQLIRDFRFGQSPDPSTKMKPPPHTPLLSDVPPELGTLFRRAFERGSQNPDARPTALDWFTALNRFRGEIVECSADVGHKFWRGAGKCVWCRLAAAPGGPEYFYGVASGSSVFAVDEDKLRELLRRVAAVQINLAPLNRQRFRSSAPPTGRALPASLAQLRQTLERAQVEYDTAFNQRKAEEAREIQQAREVCEQQLQRLQKKYEADDQELFEAYTEAQNALKLYLKDRQWVRIVLAGLTALGVFVVGFGLLHKALAIIGLLSALIFGIWLALDYAMTLQSEAAEQVRKVQRQREKLEAEFQQNQTEKRVSRNQRQEAARHKTDEYRQFVSAPLKKAEQAFWAAVQDEANRRSKAYQATERQLTELEQASVKHINELVLRQNGLEPMVQQVVRSCRELNVHYQQELQRLQVSAEVAAKTRFLRLHSLDGATIPNIGGGRKRTLAAYGILTAYDVNESAILRIPGFGPSLTNNIMAWRDGVVRSFRFDPKLALSSADLKRVIDKYVAQQAKFIYDAEQVILDWEQYRNSLRDYFSRQEAEMRRCVQLWEQAAADHAITARPEPKT